MSLLSLINKSKKVKKLADKSKLFKKKKSSKSNPTGTRYKDQFDTPQDYNQFLRDFAFQYKTLSPRGIKILRRALGEDFWKNIRLAARRKGYINTDDTSKVYNQQTGYNKTQEIQLTMPKQKLKNQRREKIQEVWKEILDAAPKDKKTGLPIISGVSKLFPRNTLPVLIKKYPELFSDIDQGVMSDLLRADKTFGRLEYPKFKIKDLNPEEKLLKNLFPKYTDNPQLVDDIDKQYIVDIWRSRPGQFRTGDFNKDVPNFLTFLRKQEFFNPRNEKTYFRSRGEYDDYALMRENQPKGKHLAHTVPTLNPEGYKSFPPGSTPWSGGEAGKMHYLDPDINLKTQPELERQYIGALADENSDLMKKIDQDMIDQDIRSTIVNPNPRFSDEDLVKLFLHRNKIKERFGLNFEDFLSEDIYPIGGTSDIRFSGGGLVKLLNKLKLTKKQKELIKRTAFNKKNKPGTGPKALREERIKKKIRDLYGKEKRWKYVKSEIEGPKSSLQRKQDKEFFEHTEFWPEKKKKAKGGIVSFYVR